MAPSTAFPGNVFYYLILVGFVGFFIAAVAVRIVPLLKAKRVNRLDSMPQRVWGVALFVLGQLRLLRHGYLYSGIAHALIFWGFVILLIRSINLLLGGFHEDASLQSLLRDVYTVYRPVMDLFNVVVIVGVIMAGINRVFIRPARLTLNIDAWFILGLIFFLMVSDVLGNSAEISMERGGADYVSFWAFGLANLWDRLGFEGLGLELMHSALWYSHVIFLLGFLCYLPFSKHSHILTVLFNVFFRTTQPSGVLQPIPNIEEQEVFGVGQVSNFTWKQILDFYTCTECGRCEINCPAFLTDKALSPKRIMHDMRYVVEQEVRSLTPLGSGSEPKREPKSLIESVGFEVIWDCVTCGACQYQCPVFNEHVPALQDLRRYLVMDEANMPETAAATLMQLEQRGHPWRGTQFTRTDWMEGMDIPTFDGSQEYLYWVGCTGALVDRNIPITQALARLLTEAGISFGCLGEEETCSGDPARRMGNEYLFQLQAQQTIEVWKAKGVKKVITSCPHCFNTFKHEYPQFDGHFEVIHHAELLAQLLREGRLQPKNGLAARITYHDSCYLGRHNNIYQAPREVIAALPKAQFIEFPRNRANAFCCGAGGGHMWVEETPGQRINNVRTQEAQEAGAQIIATACPFCVQMFEDGIPTVEPDEEKRMKTMDIAELLQASVAAEPALSAAAEPAPSSSQDQEGGSS